jgi:hypothetical protein
LKARVANSLGKWTKIFFTEFSGRPGALVIYLDILEKRTVGAAASKAGGGCRAAVSSFVPV